MDDRERWCLLQRPRWLEAQASKRTVTSVISISPQSLPLHDVSNFSRLNLQFYETEAEYSSSDHLRFILAQKIITELKETYMLQASCKIKDFANA